MSTDVFSILMVIAFGSMAGTGTGLILGYLTEKKPCADFSIAGKNTLKTVTLVIVCSVFCIALLAYFSLVNY